MTVEERVRAAARELRADGYTDDAALLDQHMDYICEVWRRSPEWVALADDLADLRDHFDSVLLVLGRHVTV